MKKQLDDDRELGEEKRERRNGNGIARVGEIITRDHKEFPRARVAYTSVAYTKARSVAWVNRI